MKVVIASIVVVFVSYAFYALGTNLWNRIRKSRQEDAEKKLTNNKSSKTTKK